MLKIDTTCDRSPVPSRLSSPVRHLSGVRQHPLNCAPYFSYGPLQSILHTGRVNETPSHPKANPSLGSYHILNQNKPKQNKEKPLQPCHGLPSLPELALAPSLPLFSLVLSSALSSPATAAFRMVLKHKRILVSGPLHLLFLLH